MYAGQWIVLRPRGCQARNVGKWGGGGHHAGQLEVRREREILNRRKKEIYAYCNWKNIFQWPFEWRLNTYVTPNKMLLASHCFGGNKCKEQKYIAFTKEGRERESERRQKRPKPSSCLWVKAQWTIQVEKPSAHATASSRSFTQTLLLW